MTSYLTPLGYLDDQRETIPPANIAALAACVQVREIIGAPVIACVGSDPADVREFAKEATDAVAHAYGILMVAALSYTQDLSILQRPLVSNPVPPGDPAKAPPREKFIAQLAGYMQAELEELDAHVRDNFGGLSHPGSAVELEMFSETLHTLLAWANDFRTVQRLLEMLDSPMPVGEAMEKAHSEGVDTAWVLEIIAD